MKASEEEIQILQKIQELDRIIFRSHKALKNLPQPAEAQRVHDRLVEVSAKLEKVEAMLAKKRRDFGCLEREYDQLRERIEKVPAKIDSAQGDYRSVQTWTRDMEIMGDRSKVLDEKMAVLLEGIEQVEAVRAQAAAGVDQLKAHERKLYDEFNDQGNALKAEIAKCQEAVKLLAKHVSPELMKRYIDTVAKCGGVGLAKLSDGCCDACRNRIPENRLPQIRENAPIAQCPSCGRMLIVESA